MFIHCLYCLYCMGMFLMSCIKIHIFIISQPYMATKTAPSCSAWLPEVQHHSAQPVFAQSHNAVAVLQHLRSNSFKEDFSKPTHSSSVSMGVPPGQDLSLAATTRIERPSSHLAHCLAIALWGYPLK